MKVLVVYAHPSREGSHNSSVLEEVLAFLDEKAVDYRLIDLYGESFRPELSRKEWEDHKFAEEKIVEYQRAVRDSSSLIFIYPVWWYTCPAILKGFFDRVFTSGFAYNFRKEPLWMKAAASLFGPLLSIRLLYPIYSRLLPVDQHLSGKKALMINTFGGDAAGLRLYGDAPRYSVDRAILEFCGVRPVYRVHWFNARHKDDLEIPSGVKKRIHAALARLV
ncbi:MAG: NAD(P)H-dependent oxidoreductase [Candidatus Micrarchaeia archaeon]